VVSHGTASWCANSRAKVANNRRSAGTKPQSRVSKSTDAPRYRQTDTSFRCVLDVDQVLERLDYEATGRRSHLGAAPKAATNSEKTAGSSAAARDSAACTTTESPTASTAAATAAASLGS
jgi:hypothetical protein